MTERELITVIVPIYKVEPYLRKCVDSIRNQTYRNLEILLVDDGSPDQCGKICDEYAALDERIQVIHKSNGGLSDARNAGIDRAQGEYISFVDSDDYVHPKFLELLHSMLVKERADIAVCGLQYVAEEEEIHFEDTKIHDRKTWIFLSGQQAQQKYFDKEQRVIYTVAWNKLYKKEFFQEIRYPKGKIHEDEFTTFRLLYPAKKIVVAKDQLYYYLTRKQSIMGQFSKKRFDLLEAYRAKMRFYAEHGETECYRKTVQLYMRMTAQYMQWIQADDTGCRQLALNHRREFIKLHRQLAGKRKLPARQKMEYLLFAHWLFGYEMVWNLAKRKKAV